MWLKKLIGRPCPRCGKRVRAKDPICLSCGLPYILVRGRAGLVQALQSAEREVLHTLDFPMAKLQPVSQAQELLRNLRFTLRITDMALRLRFDPKIRDLRIRIAAQTQRLRRRIRYQFKNNKREWKKLQRFMKMVEKRETRAVLAMGVDEVTEYYKLGP